MKKLLLILAFGLFFIATARADSYSLQVRFIVPDQTPPTFTNLRNLSGYTNQAFTRYITATDNVGVDCYFLNDTSTFNIDCTGEITNSITLDTITIYYLNLSVNDTSGNINWGEFYINITNPVTGGGTALTCRYKLFGYYNSELNYLKEANCV